MTTNRSGHSDDTIAAYDRLIATVPGVERKGATLHDAVVARSWTYVNGLKPKPTTRKTKS